MDSNETDSKDEQIDGNESVNEAPVPVRRIKKIFTGKIIGLVALATFLVALITFSFVRKDPEVKNIPEPEKKLSAAKEVSAVVDERALVLKPFIVLFENAKDYTYIIVEVSFDVPDKILHSEMIEKQNRLRAIIYDIIINEVKRTKAIPSISELKQQINREINAVLENGKINGVFVTNFIAV
ncbi:MAG: flagellar basal body-associated FliL family protein [Proteobacteria bacterium]|nr:flagellar basal body-associated FliL family protein [Pseudomonadota bacterium]